jgi:hypothetical protein
VVLPAALPLSIVNNNVIAAYEDQATGGTPLSTLLNISGGTVKALSLLDTGRDGGYFTVNGVQQTSNAPINVSAADVASVKYYAGPNGSSEQLYVQANNGYQWNGWYAWNQASGRENIISLLSDMLTPTILNRDGITFTGSTPTFANYVDGSSPPINLDSKAFAALLGDANGNVRDSQFFSGAGAKSALSNTVLLAYDTSDGALYYDASLTSPPIEIAIIGQGPNLQLQAADLHLV